MKFYLFVNTLRDYVFPMQLGVTLWLGMGQKF